MPGLTPELYALAERLEGVFMPYAHERRLGVIERNGRFAHYTSAENALSIINGKEIWLRNTVLMSDYSEVLHGYQHLLQFFSDQDRKGKFIEALDQCAHGAGQEALHLFDQWWGHIRTSTYISSLSAHDDREDQHGRLSMWRAFGRAVAGVALILRLPLTSGSGVALGLILTPVAYFPYERVEQELFKVTANIRQNAEFIRSLDRTLVVGNVFTMLLAAAVSLKHEGFQEEREWRVVHSPKQRPSTLIVRDTAVIAGIPQFVYKIALRDNPQEGVTGVELSQMIDRVIIGPSAFPWPLYEAFVHALEKAGVSDAGNKVVVSNIPLRM